MVWCEYTTTNSAELTGGISFGIIKHFTVACLVAWSLNESDAGDDIVLIETFLLFFCSRGSKGFLAARASNLHTP